MLASRRIRTGGRIDWALMIVVSSQAVVAAPPAKPPKNAPFCLPLGTRPLFVAPMGQIFRGEAGGPDPATAWLSQADEDRNGGVSRTEMRADAARFFRTLDRDGDGRLTPDEVGRYETEIVPEISLYAARREPSDRGRRRGLFSGGGEPGYAGPVGAGRFAWLNIPEPVAAADADLDRVVTSAEFTDAADRRFDKLAKGTEVLDARRMPPTPQRAALAGPCRPPPKRRIDPWDEDGDAQGGTGA